LSWEKRVQQEHKLIVDSLLNQNESECYLIGKSFYEHKVDKDNIQFFETFDAFVKCFLKRDILANNTILVKGSRGMALERTLEYISNNKKPSVATDGFFVFRYSLRNQLGFPFYLSQVFFVNDNELILHHL
jgi:hypothetical protein